FSYSSEGNVVIVSLSGLRWPCSTLRQYLSHGDVLVLLTGVRHLRPLVELHLVALSAGQHGSEVSRIARNRKLQRRQHPLDGDDLVLAGEVNPPEEALADVLCGVIEVEVERLSILALVHSGALHDADAIASVRD